MVSEYSTLRHGGSHCFQDFQADRASLGGLEQEDSQVIVVSDILIMGGICNALNLKGDNRPTIDCGFFWFLVSLCLQFRLGC
jgi:hypothetical protein